VGVVLPYLNQPGVFALGAGSFVVAAAAVWILGKETRRLNWRKLPDKVLQSIKRDNLIHSVFGRGWSGSYPTNFSFWHIADVQLTLTNVCFERKNGHDAGVTPLPRMAKRTPSLRRHGGKCGASVSRLDGAFYGVNIAIDYLEVWQAPIGKQLRPRRSPVFAPDPKQWHAVINFGALPQPSAALAAATRLQAPQEPGVAARRVPKLPRDHTGAVPGCVHVSATFP